MFTQRVIARNRVFADRRALAAVGLNSNQCAIFLKKKNAENTCLFNFFVKARGSLFKDSYSFFFLKYFFKKGHSLKIASSFAQASLKLYSAVFENIEEKKKKYSNFFFIFNTLRLNVDFFNINFFLSWLLRSINYSFFFRVTILPKFLKKRTKQKYAIEPVFLEKRKRARTSLRIFTLGILTNRAYSLESRMFTSFLDLAFNFKKSHFFLEKKLWYAKIFKLLKKKRKLT